jgi:hypothetical protein
MKLTIRRKVQKDQVLKAIPARLAPKIPKAVLKDKEYTLILFGMDQDCVTSAFVRKALDRVQDVGPVIATGRRFTLDALKLLQRENAIIASERESFWTDESNEWAKTLIGSKVKKPAHR